MASPEFARQERLPRCEQDDTIYIMYVYIYRRHAVVQQYVMSRGRGKGFKRRTDHDLDLLDPSLPLRHVVQDMRGADPTRERCPRPCRTHGSHPAT